MRLENIVLDYYVLESIDFVELSECQTLCLMHEYCKSINYNTYGDNTCELNGVRMVSFSFTADGYLHLLRPRFGWIYMTHDSRAAVNQRLLLNPLVKN